LVREASQLFGQEVTENIKEKTEKGGRADEKDDLFAKIVPHSG
jgi:hypothetical protein